MKKEQNINVNNPSIRIGKINTDNLAWREFALSADAEGGLL